MRQCSYSSKCFKDVKFIVDDEAKKILPSTSPFRSFEPVASSLVKRYHVRNSLRTTSRETHKDACHFIVKLPTQEKVTQLGNDDGDLPASSRLSKNLVEVLTDKGALSYYIQYLDACEAASLVRFWLDVECFRSAALDTPTHISLTYEQLEGMTPHCKSTKETADKLISPDTPLKPPIQQEESILEPRNTCEPSQSMVPVCDHKVDSDIRPAPQDLNSRSVNLCECGRYILNSDSDAVISISNCKHILNNISMEMGDQVVSDFASAGSRSEADISRDGPQDGRSSDTSPKSPCQCYDVAQSSVNDAVRIYRTYIGHGATHPIPLSEEVKTRVAANICVQDNQLDPECFTEAQNIIYQIMDKEYINDFLRSEFHCKHQIDVLTSSKVTLFDILYNDTALFYFMEFIEQEGHHSLLEFWLAAVNFRQQLLNKVDNYDPMEAQNDAMILYDKFFSLQATSPLGFNDRVRIEMEHNICREEGPLPDCFQKPVKIVTKVLEKVSEVSKMGSECSSEFSISTQNTLLAMEDSAPPRKILRNVDHHELSIDLQQLYDPDSLWRRRHHNSHKHVELGGLSFGRINEMGRFETDFEPEPGKKGESKITKVMKKLVNMEEDKAKAIVEHYSRSPSTRKRLHTVMEEMVLPVLELIQFVDTRWSSEYNMLSRLHAVRKAVGAELANSENNIEILTEVEWKQAAGIVEVLGPLADATKEISGDSYPTSSMKDGVMFARSLDKALKSRFSFYDSDPIFCPSMLCDPRFRGVLIDDMVAVNTLAIEVKKLSDKSSLEPNVKDEHPSCSSSSSGLWSSFDSIPNTTQPAIDNNSEVKDYLNEPRVPISGGGKRVLENTLMSPSNNILQDLLTITGWALIQSPCFKGNYDEYGRGTSMATLTHVRLLHHPIVELDGTGLGLSAADLASFLDSLIVVHHIVSSKKELPLYHLKKYQLAMKFGLWVSPLHRGKSSSIF
uniref:(California timema) hypothetical protein n=1 Tax=Timema californicum TaxID=61474 RepID=A0A7R9P7C0_TIMCA|nr:unnamed protein product [Timema californicum]